MSARIEEPKKYGEDTERLSAGMECMDGTDFCRWTRTTRIVQVLAVAGCEKSVVSRADAVLELPHLENTDRKWATIGVTRVLLVGISAFSDREGLEAP